jgi:hypothetical protein
MRRIAFVQWRGEDTDIHVLPKTLRYRA